jgi:hypothetical protein
MEDFTPLSEQITSKPGGHGFMQWLYWGPWWRYDHCKFFQVCLIPAEAYLSQCLSAQAVRYQRLDGLVVAEIADES